MKTVALPLVAVLVLASGSFGAANAAAEKPLLVPGYEAAQDLPGARELPDPKTDYKVVFADNQEPKDPSAVNPMLPTIAQYVNTLGKYGVLGPYAMAPGDFQAPGQPARRALSVSSITPRIDEIVSGYVLWFVSLMLNTL